MIAPRTTARSVILLLAGLAVLIGLLLSRAPTGAAQAGAVPRLIFPVVGPVFYFDDFGDPRGQGAHEGNDVVAPRRALAVAAEAGRVRFWTRSLRAGCMLYLHGESGTTYLYVHLNNDLHSGNDNRGPCVSGVAYAPGLKDGAHVEAGQPIGFVGNSGDAELGQPHLHFEVHPSGGEAVNPFRHLNRAQRLLFAAPPDETVTLSLSGKLVSATNGSLSLRVSDLEVFPTGLELDKVGRVVTLSLPAGAFRERATAGEGKSVVVLTEPTAATLEARLGRPSALSAARVAVR